MLNKVLIFVAISALVGVLVMAGFSWSAKKPDNLGVNDGRLLACPTTPNCVCSFDTNSVHGIQPLAFSDEPAEAWQRLQDVLTKQPRCQIVVREDDYLQAEFTSLVFRFVDDVEFLLDPVRRVIHCRSASRVGRSDLGANRARIEAIRAAFGG